MVTNFASEDAARTGSGHDAARDIGIPEFENDG